MVPENAPMLHKSLLACLRDPEDSATTKIMTFSTQTIDLTRGFLVFLVRTSYTAADTLTGGSL